MADNAVIQHAKTSSIPDSAAPSRVRPSDWNAAHVITLSGLLKALDELSPSIGDAPGALLRLLSTDAMEVITPSALRLDEFGAAAAPLSLGGNKITSLADPTNNQDAATKGYVDSIAGALDAWVLKGTLDCSANPNYPAADAGWSYVIRVAGKIGGASGKSVDAGDVVLCLLDGTGAGNEASVGTAWAVLQANLVGAVLLDAVQTLTNKVIDTASNTIKIAGTQLSSLGTGLVLIAGALSRQTPINAQTGTSYTIATADREKLVTLTNAGAVAVTLDHTVGNGFACDVANFGAGNVTLTPDGGATIDGGASLVLSTNDGIRIVCDGANFKTIRGRASGAAVHTVFTRTGDVVATAGDYSYSLLGGSPPVAEMVNRRNAGFEVWQRGTNIALAASTTAYTADGWYLKTGANQACHVSQQAGLADQSNYCARVQRDSGQTGTGVLYFAHPLDLDELKRAAGNKIQLLFTVATGANWSPSSGTLNYAIYFGTGAVAKRNSSAFTGETAVITGSVNVAAGASAAQVLSAISASAVPSNVTQAEIQFSWTPVGTAGANDWFAIDDVGQCNIPSAGVAAGRFERLSFDHDLSLCERHFFKTFSYATAPAQNAGPNTGELTWSAMFAGALTNRAPTLWFRRRLRSTAPTVTLFNPEVAGVGGVQIRDQTLGGDCSASGSANAIDSGALIFCTGNASTAVGNRLGVHVTADASI